MMMIVYRNFKIFVLKTVKYVIKYNLKGEKRFIFVMFEGWMFFYTGWSIMRVILIINTIVDEDRRYLQAYFCHFYILSLSYQ